MIKKTPLKSLFPIIAVIALGSALLDYFLPAMGDDLGKWTALGLQEYTHPDRQTISFLAGHYFSCNGRILDSLGPAVINLLPAVLAAAVMGLMVAFYFIMMLTCAGFWKRGRVTAGYILIFATIAVMPWYGAMYLRVCQFNYLWGTAFCLLTIHLFFKDNNRPDSVWYKLLLMACAMTAGFSHEQNGVAMCAVMLPCGWIMYRSSRLTSNRKSLLSGLIIGTVITLASPAIWNRADNLIADSTIGNLLITTLPVYLLLLLVIAIMAISKKGRAELLSLAKTPWIVYVAVGFVASLIAIYSTTPGRTGWLSESMALVAFAIILSKNNIRLSKTVATIICSIIFIIISWHFAASVKWQTKLGKEYNEVVGQFICSDNGTVFVDITPYNAAPAITLWRAKGAPDADDVHLYRCIENAYGPDKHLVIIPKDFESLFPLTSDSIVAGQYTVYRHKPSTLSFHDLANYKIEKTLDGRVLSEFMTPDSTLCFIASPHIIDPGDNWHRESAKP